jgi:KDO2-lipid IV(A) lauroyltransferase
MLTRWLIRLMRLLGHLPLPLLRGLGLLLGAILFAAVSSRRKVVWVNLQLCFPKWSRVKVFGVALRTFMYFAQAWLDRGWLWHGSDALLRQRLRLVGAVPELFASGPLVIFAPHFVGLDAGWTCLTQQVPRRWNTIYTDQENATADAWILQGRQRFAGCRLFGRSDGVKSIVAGVKAGEALYLLPDMNFGPEDSVFVPFFGVPAATVPSLSRFARLGRARVLALLSRMTPHGYDIEALPVWSDFPSADALADTARMNLSLQEYIESMPAQYYWVHKRFKDRPPGQTPPY